jgi:hypothetical protein
MDLALTKDVHMTKVKKLKALLDVLRLPNDTFVSRLTKIHDSLFGNAAFNNPPVDLTLFQTGISNYAAAVVAALDGGKQAVANMNKLREGLVKMVEQLAHYVEANSNDDVATFTSSGFEIRPTARVAPQPLVQPEITGIDQGKTGELLVAVTPVKKARMYEIRYAPVGGGVNPITVTVPRALQAVPIENLTPGTTYTFQVRAYGTLGFTDWSNPQQRMCI